ncbi:nitronate monooxygenase [Mycobacterium intracellulare]|uniref:Propionate 3-nitronate monooxygenase n=1 Tax=Mycobacterium intracellulare TaxID=1767 RepID=A0AAE4RG63_MYCIT|nr:nitronate monooxygenase [Mycobacterium intracellulare]MDV6979452.1 nitronate monooxygenase [Mycobacterium intracellulare]MDV6984955.1 nitronate monooxygenase [Mycobacterium intracellulare]MDV7015226.1 nitronate monooxygenase [Mycobacterium intracellulare]MDV7031091.1 nitronate monooxygenase [Mycobacterium intracellulare]
MFDRFSLAELGVRVLAAPMAGGPSTPALAAAVTNGGGLGFLAAGMLSAEDLAENILAARKLTSGALGVNLFVPQQPVAISDQLAAYAAALVREAQRYGVALGESRHTDDEWDAKLDVVCDLRPEVVSFTFGVPSEEECRRLSSVGIFNLATVTSVREAVIALSCGVDALVAQGPDAGGHRATFDALAAPPQDRLDDLVAALVACCDCPVAASGGLATTRDVARVLDAGATAVQCGTAFLLAEEAGTNSVHRAALGDPQFTQTAVTRAFTGRYARALRNRFIEKHDYRAVFGFPEVAILTAPIQAAAVKLGDPHGVALWAGAAFQHTKTGSAADLVRELAG